MTDEGRVSRAVNLTQQVRIRYTCGMWTIEVWETGWRWVGYAPSGDNRESLPLQDLRDLAACSNVAFHSNEVVTDEP